MKEISIMIKLSQTIQKFKPTIICEVDDKDKQSFMRKHQKFDAFMRALGYEITTLEAAYPGNGWHVGHAVAIPSKA